MDELNYSRIPISVVSLRPIERTPLNGKKTQHAHVLCSCRTNQPPTNHQPPVANKRTNLIHFCSNLCVYLGYLRSNLRLIGTVMSLTLTLTGINETVFSDVDK